MKKFWLVLLSLGLIMAFSVSAFAVDVKISAEYYAAGLYLNKISVNDGNNYEGNDENPSTAFFFQRLRMGTDFIVSPCLKLVTRFDAMERIWGGARTSGYGGQDSDDYYDYYYSAGTRAENENIAFDLVYIDYTAPIGQFKVGYQKDYVWGTVFNDWGEGVPAGQIQYWKSFGPATLFVGYAKEVDKSYSAVTYWEDDQTDHDYDSYRLGGIYNFKADKVKGEAGLLFTFDRDATHKYRDSTGHWGHAYLGRYYTLNPYAKATIGPVALQGELVYNFGDYEDYEGIVNHHVDKKLDEWAAFLDATANFGMFNVGGSIAWVSGDDPNTRDRIEGGFYNDGGLDWNPCLILFNTQTLGYWVGPIDGHGQSFVDQPMSNAWFFQGRVGVKPTPQWDIMMSVSHALADKKPDPYDTHGHHTYANGTYGTEIDLTATYKITNNLSYMLGAGYLFTGDYFKGYDWDSDYKVCDDFILINKLTLTF